MVRDAKGGPTVPQRNRLIVDNKLPLSSIPINTIRCSFGQRLLKVNLTYTHFPHLGNTDLCETQRHKSPVIATNCCDHKIDGFV